MTTRFLPVLFASYSAASAAATSSSTPDCAGVASCPEAGRYLEGGSVRRRDEQFLEILADLLRQCACSAQIRSGQHDSEFLASVTAREVQLANGLGQGLSDTSQNVVARLVAVGVVDRLEVVDVGDHEGDVRAEPPGVVDFDVEALVERATVGEIRQAVGLRLAGQACEIGKDAGNGACETRRKPGRKRESDRCDEEQTPSVRIHPSVDGGDRLNCDE